MRPLWLLLTALSAAACSNSKASEKPAPRETRMAVKVARLAPEAVEYAISATGSVEAFERIQITARVAGAVERAEFKEGDRVEKGAILVEIEPRRFQLAGAAAAADVARAKTAREEAERELERAQKMVSEGVGSSMEAATWASKRDSAEAALAAAKASAGLAALNVQDAHVRAPASGVIQTRNVQTGEHVAVGKVLATLVRRDPLLLRFDVPESDASRLATGMKAELRIPGATGHHVASITHVAEAADATTRMVSIIAEVEGGESLRPGTFCEVKVPVGTANTAIVAPQGAIRSTERGFVAFVIDQDRARERQVVLGMRTPDGRVEVKSGLSASELLVVRGAEALREGAAVHIDDAPAPTAPGAGSAGPSGSAAP